MSPSHDDAAYALRRYADKQLFAEPGTGTFAMVLAGMKPEEAEAQLQEAVEATKAVVAEEAEAIAAAAAAELAGEGDYLKGEPTLLVAKHLSDSAGHADVVYNLVRYPLVRGSAGEVDREGGQVDDRAAATMLDLADEKKDTLLSHGPPDGPGCAHINNPS